jgi:geranylgeranyl pyrophosphate synthase
MSAALTAAQASEQAGMPLAPPSFVLLPLLSCEVAGGAQAAAVPVASAWRAIHIAAKLLDDVEDGDISGSSVPGAINLATGFFAAAGLALLRLDPHAQAAVLPLFYGTILRMSSGQHRDINDLTHDLHAYEQLLADKSGSFFGLAALAGAACATSAERCKSLLHTFGFNLGIYLQIVDDHLDWHRPDTTDLALGRATLPICYLRSVGTEAERQRLQQLIDAALAGGPEGGQAHADVRRLAADTGADAYTFAEMARYKGRALAALDELDFLDLHTGPLREWFDSFTRLAAKH